ncbi:unnamed protein product [Cunninghamella blakesleeana]
MMNQSMISFINKVDADAEVDVVWLDPGHSSALLCVIIMVCLLPNEIQHVICHIVLKQILNNGHINMTQLYQLITVNRIWAHFVCSYLYRDFTSNKFITFLHFYNTVISKSKSLPYGKYVQRLDLTAINKYGIDTKTHHLLRYCPNLLSVTLGHPTSLKPSTIQYLTTHCPKLRYLSVGALESFPFMLECDFSSLKSLTGIHFITTPLSTASFLTLPRTRHLKELHLTKILSLCDHTTLVQFFNQHPSIDTLILSQSMTLLLYDHHHPFLPFHQLKTLHISHTPLQDQHLLNILHRKGTLHLFILEKTQISSSLIQTIRHDDHSTDYLLSVNKWLFI